MRFFGYNDKILKPFRKKLRSEATPAENKLWFYLRKRQVLGLRFFRQYSIGPYILDFYSPNKRLAIEVDGGQHNEPQIEEADLERTKYLNAQNVKVIRFWNNDVLEKPTSVVEEIINTITHTPSLGVREGREG